MGAISRQKGDYQMKIKTKRVIPHQSLTVIFREDFEKRFPEYDLQF